MEARRHGKNSTYELLKSIGCYWPASLSFGSGLIVEKVWDPVFQLNACEDVFSNKKRKLVTIPGVFISLHLFIQQLWRAEMYLLFCF